MESEWNTNILGERNLIGLGTRHDQLQEEICSDFLNQIQNQTYIYIYIFLICDEHKMKARSSKIRQKGLFYEFQRIAKSDKLIRRQWGF